LKLTIDLSLLIHIDYSLIHKVAPMF